MTQDQGASPSGTGPAPSGLSPSRSRAEPLVPSADDGAAIYALQLTVGALCTALRDARHNMLSWMVDGFGMDAGLAARFPCIKQIDDALGYKPPERGMSPGTSETAQQAPGEAGQPGADRHAPNTSGGNNHAD